MNIFFQSSLPRSGSTLLQNILGQNPDFYVTPTSGVLELLYMARGYYSNGAEFKAQDPALMRDGFMSFCKNGLEGFFDGVTDKPYVMDKSRGWGVHYGFLNAFYPDPKIVCMVRDPRDIFASMEKNYRKSPELDSGLINWTNGQNTTTEKRVEYWSSTPPVGMAFERLLQMFKEGTAQKMHFIKYENLCIDPAVVMSELYKFLGVDGYEHDFDNVEQITKEDDSVYGIYGDHNIRSKVSPTVSSADKILGVPLCNQIKERYRWFYETFNY